MGQIISDANQQPDLASCQAALKIAVERAKQIEIWEQIALTKLAKANIKNAELHQEHHQTFLQLRSCLQHVDAVQAHMNATMQARDRDIFWRLGNRVRKFISIFPRPVITYSRKTLKLLYWIVTPWKMKPRLQYIKNRNNVQAKLLNDGVQNTGYTFESDQNKNDNNITMNASTTDLYRRIKISMTES